MLITYINVELIKTAGVAQQSNMMSEETLEAIDTIVEIQRIVYYNKTWYQSILLKYLIVKDPKKLTLRKMFGVYLHNISSHAGLMFRVISGLAAKAERQGEYLIQSRESQSKQLIVMLARRK